MTKTRKNKVKLLKPLSRAQFNRLGADRKRVLIAEDVIAQIKLGTYIPTSGEYISFAADDTWDGTRFFGELAKKADPLHELLNSKGDVPECTVCGIGAACCSAVRLFDKAKYTKDGGEKVLNMWSTINEYFPNASKQPINGVEYWFERSGGEEGWCAIEDDTIRMTAIFQHIIYNKGKLDFPDNWWHKHVPKKYWEEAKEAAKAKIAKLEKEQALLDGQRDKINAEIYDLEMLV